MTTLREQAKRLGISAPALCKRLKKWDPDRALSTPKQAPDAPRPRLDPFMFGNGGRHRPQPWSPIQREPEAKPKCLGDLVREQAAAEGRIGSALAGGSDTRFYEHWRPKPKPAPVPTPNKLAGQRRRRERERGAKATAQPASASGRAVFGDTGWRRAPRTRQRRASVPHSNLRKPATKNRRDGVAADFAKKK